MKIKSKFKDYYDSISWKYGRDEDCVYLRGKLSEDNLEFDWEHGSMFHVCWRMWDHNHSSMIKFVVAGMHVVPFMCNQLDKNIKPVRLTAKHDHLFHRNCGPDHYYNEAELKKLIKLVNAPVFIVHEQFVYDQLVVDKHVPILKDWGFSDIVPASQMWQDIYTTLTTVLRKNPDKEPPITVSNDEKIQAAGFDLKTSFRHPINEKLKKGD